MTLFKSRSILVYAAASMIGVQSCNPALAQTATSFDLSSTQQSVTLSSEHFEGADSALVNVGGTKTTFKPGDSVTPAVFAALRQVVLNNGHQPLKLDDAGRAVGGKFSLNQILQSSVSNLIIPDNVTALHDASSALSITGNLITQGSLISSTKQALQTFSINTGFLQVDPTGRISTKGSDAALNLSLFSATDIVNHGIIESSGSANLTAMGSIINQAAAGSSVVPTISAIAGVNLQALSGSITNSGIISSLGSNVAFNTATGRDLIINNAGGQILAPAGNVLLRSPEFNEKRRTELLGGLVEAQSLTAYGGDGVTSILSDEIRAPININAGEAHVRVNQGDLRIQSMNLTGDPSIVNTGGDIFLIGNGDGGATLRFSGQGLAIIASGDINADPALNLIDLGSTTDDGGNLLIAAGFLATPSTGGAQVESGPETTYIISGPSASGGNVNLSGVGIYTGTTADGATAGNAIIVAHDSEPVPNSFGQVSIGSINTTSSTGDGGTVRIIAQSGPLNIDGFIATAGDFSGAIEIYGGEPVTQGTVKVKNGDLVSGSFAAIVPDPAHSVVDININNTLDSRKNTSDGTGNYIDIATSGNITVSSGVNIFSGGTLLLSTSDGSVDIQGSNQLTALNQMFIETEEDSGLSQIHIGLNAQFFTTDSLVLYSGGNIVDDGGNVYYSEDFTLLLAMGGLDIGDGSSLLSENELILANGAGPMNIGNNVTLISLEMMGILNVSSGGLNIGTGGVISAGALEPTAPASGVLLPSDLSTTGFTVIYSEGTINLGSSVTANGGDLLVLAVNGDLALAPNTDFEAIGGHIAMFASQQITGDSNSFVSRAAGFESNYKGGLIQLSSGFSFNPDVLTLTPEATSEEVLGLSKEILAEAKTLTKLLKAKTFISPELDPSGIVLDPSIMGSNVEINSNAITPGLVRATTIGGGVVDISGTSIDMEKGGLLFDAVGSSASISLPGSTFNIQSYGIAPTKYFNNLVKQVEVALGLSEPFQFEFRSSTILNTDQEGQRMYQTVVSDREKANDLKALPDPKNVPLITREHLLAPAGEGRRAAPSESRANIISTDTKHASAGSLGTVVPVGLGSAPNLGSQSRREAPVISVGESRRDLMFFTTTNQVMRGDMAGSPSATVVGQQGTSISASPREGLIVHDGRVLANTSQSPMRIDTNLGEIQVGTDSTAAVEVVPGKGVQVTVLRGTSAQAVSVSVHGATNKIPVRAGESLTLDETAASENSNQSRAVQVASKGQISIRDSLSNDDFFRTAIRLGGSRSSGKLYGGIKQTAVTLSDTMPPLVFKATDGDPVQVIGKPGSLIKNEDEKSIRLLEGSIFVHSDRDQLVITEVGTVDIKAGSIAAVDVENGKMRVRACSGPGHVLVDAQNHKFPLAPGQEVLVATYRPTKADALGSDEIARRRLEVHRLSNGSFAVTGDFSIVSMLKTGKHLNILRNSTRPIDKEMMLATLRTAASVEMATVGHGRYYVKPAETASIPDWVFRNPRNASNLLVSSASF